MLHYSYILTANIVYKFFEVLFSFKKKKNDGSTTNNFSAADIHIQYINPLGWGSISHHNSIFPPRRKEKIVTQKSHPGQRGRIIKNKGGRKERCVTGRQAQKHLYINIEYILCMLWEFSLRYGKSHLSFFHVHSFYLTPRQI